MSRMLQANLKIQKDIHILNLIQIFKKHMERRNCWYHAQSPHPWKEWGGSEACVWPRWAVSAPLEQLYIYRHIQTFQRTCGSQKWGSRHDPYPVTPEHSLNVWIGPFSACLLPIKSLSDNLIYNSKQRSCSLKQSFFVFLLTSLPYHYNQSLCQPTNYSPEAFSKNKSLYILQWHITEQCQNWVKLHSSVICQRSCDMT